MLQRGEETRIFHLRPPGCSYLPVYIMHEAFDTMARIIDQDQEFDAADFALLENLLAAMGKGFSTENNRRDVVNDIFNQFLFSDLRAPIGVKSIATGTTDGTTFDAGVNIEYKNEKGTGGGDPYLQNAAYYVQFWTDKGIENENDQKRGPQKHCCPWILVEVLGQEIGLTGAVFADGVPCIQPLTCNVPFLPAPMGRHLRTSQLRLCKALRFGAGLLSQWYKEPKAVSDQATFPYIRSYNDDANGTEVRFAYKERLDIYTTGSLFLAETDNNADIIVKFVEIYGEDVHRKLFDMDMAPKLYAVEKTAHSFQMVVMHFEPDARMWDPAVDGVDDTKKTRLKNILEALKRDDFVHGDLRCNNLLVCSDGTVKLIDFDWAGKVGSARYPVELNPEAGFHRDASVGRLISFEHDHYMANKLLMGDVSSL
jgi:hypothetical protein